MAIPTYEPGYRMVLAAALYSSFAGLAVYVKYRKGPQEIRLTHRDGDSVSFTTPDRELLLTKRASYTSFNSPMGGYDEAYDFNLMNDRVLRGMDIDYTMTNYTHEKHDRFQGDRSLSKIPNSQRATFLSDSGGLQIVRGQLDKIHPQDLAKFYINTVDAGMALDIPIGNIDIKTLVRAAELQRKNTNIMLDTINEAGSKTGILNIFHGYTTDERNIYRDIVEDKRVDRCAIGGVYSQGMLASVNTIISMCQGMHYKQYHVLGVFSYVYIALLVKISHFTQKHITSDTTSFTQAALNKLYVHQPDESFMPRSLKIGRSESTGNSFRILKDQCPVCEAIKYTDILGMVDSDPTIRLLSIHNALEMKRYADSLNEAVKVLSPTQYNNLVYKQMHKHGDKAELKQCFDFIDIAADKSLKKAQEKYKKFTNNVRRAPNANRTLFGEQGLTKDYDAILTKMEKQIA